MSKQTWMTELEYLYRAVAALEDIYIVGDIAGLDSKWAIEQAVTIRMEIARILRGERPHRTIPQPQDNQPAECDNVTVPASSDPAKNRF